MSSRPRQPSTPALRRHAAFQTGLMSALLDGLYDGDTSVARLLRSGDFGLGTFDALDGEMLVVDGVCWRIRAGGSVTEAAGDDRTPFAVVTRFVPMRMAEVRRRSSRQDIVELVHSLTGSDNYLYAVRLRGRFESVRTRTAARQSPPYRRLVDATRGEPVTTFTDVFGVVAGFRTPLFEQGIGVAGGHVHFVDDERRLGGHVLDFVLTEGRVEVCICTDLQLALPVSAAFAGADLTPADLQSEVAHVENHH